MDNKGVACLLDVWLRSLAKVVLASSLVGAMALVFVPVENQALAPARSVDGPATADVASQPISNAACPPPPRCAGAPSHEADGGKLATFDAGRGAADAP